MFQTIFGERSHDDIEPESAVYESVELLSKQAEQGTTVLTRRLRYRRFDDSAVGDPKLDNRIERDEIGNELATGSATLIIDGTKLPENPDELIKKKGLEIYDTMKTDPMVKAALFIKKFSRLATQWTIKPASTASKDVEIAEFYEKQLESLPGTVIQMLLGMMTCLDYGFAIMEKNYYFIKEGDYRGKTGLSSIKSKKPHDFRFEQDEFCNVEGLVQIQSKGEVKLPPSKFIRTTWMPEWENPYGTADLRAAYVAWWQKDVILRFQAIWLERYPSPIMIGRYPPGTSQDDQDDLLEVLEDLQIHTEAIIPEGIVIEPIKMDRSGSDIYTKAIDKRDTMIGQAILIPELLGFTSRSTGSYALGKKQFDLFLGVLWHLGRTIEEVIHEQLTIPFIDWNYGVNEDYPEFEFEALAEEGAETKAKILATLASAGVIDPTDPETREWIGDYLSILPQTKTKASEMAQDALSFHDTFKFYSPKGDEVFEVEIMETAARMELLNDALQKTE